MPHAHQARVEDVKYAAIQANTVGDNTIVSAQGAGKKIRVLSYTVVTSSAATLRFESGAGGTALTGVMSLAANGGVNADWNEGGWFETLPNQLLNLELSAASTGGSLSYIVVT